MSDAPDLRTAARAAIRDVERRVDTCPGCDTSKAHGIHGKGCSWKALRSAALAAEATEPPPAAIDAAHLAHQREWSRETFGPGPRTLGVIDHIRKELVEIEADPADLGEWVDVIILSFDGAWRAGWEPQEIIDAVKGKQARNEARTWPDWRAMSEDHAIEHDRTSEQVAGSAPSPQGADEPAVIWTCPPCRRGEHGDCMDAGTGTCQCAQNDHGTAGGGVPDEPGDDDPWLSREDFEHYRKAPGALYGTAIPPLSEDMRRAAYDQCVAIVDSHRALLAEVERLRAAAPASDDDRTRRNEQRVRLHGLLTRWIHDDGDAWDAAGEVLAQVGGDHG